MLCGIDQFPESRSIVFKEELPGDFSEGCPVAFMFAVRVEIEGRVWFEAAGVVGLEETDSHGRWATESMSRGAHGGCSARILRRPGKMKELVVPARSHYRMFEGGGVSKNDWGVGEK